MMRPFQPSEGRLPGASVALSSDDISRMPTARRLRESKQAVFQKEPESRSREPKTRYNKPLYRMINNGRYIRFDIKMSYLRILSYVSISVLHFKKLY